MEKRQTLSQGSKDRKQKEYYRDMCDRLDRRLSPFAQFRPTINDGLVDRERRIKANYDLYNGVLNIDDFAHLTNGLGIDLDVLPSRLVNRDIVSTKLKAIMGLDLERPFEAKVAAVNREATTEAEQEAFGMVKQFVYDEIMGPIREAVMTKMMEGGEVDEESLSAAEQEIEAMTPDKIAKYMERKYQSPAEKMAEQLLEYLTLKEDLPDKFRKQLKAATLSALEVYYIGEKGGHPTVTPVNPIYVDLDINPDLDYIEDAEWLSVEYRKTPSQVISEYGDELSKKDIDEIYDYYNYSGQGFNDDAHWEQMWDDRDGIRVIHTVWKGLRKVGFLTYEDENGDEQEMLVPEDYKLDKKIGDISIKWDWIPEVHEATKIMKDKYVRCRPMPNQHKDINNLYECKLPYVGAIYDHENSVPTSLMDRMKEYQYLYNIVWFRIEQAMASDKGKRVFLNYNAIPRNDVIGLEEFEYYFETNNIGYLDPNQEGLKNFHGTIPELVKEVDLSAGQSIEKYMNIADYLDRKCGEVIGVPKELEGNIHQRSAVRNVQQTIHIASSILEEFLAKRARVKRNVMQALVEKAKVVYYNSDMTHLSYVMDDMTKHMLTLDLGLLDSSTFGVFIIDSREAHQIKQDMKELAHAAMQNGVIGMSDLMKVQRARGLQEQEEMLERAERDQQERQQQLQMMEHQNNMEFLEAQMESEQRKHEMKLEEIRVLEKERRETAIKKQLILAMGFNDDKDMNDNDVPDTVEVAKEFLDKHKGDDLKEVPNTEPVDSAPPISP